MSGNEASSLGGFPEILGRRQWHLLPYYLPCQNACIFCCEADGSALNADALRSPEALREHIGRLPAETGLVLGRGEPTRTRAFPETLRFFAEFGRPLWLLTNGRLLGHGEFARAVVQQCQGVVVALHGPERSHDGLTQHPESFRQTVGGLRKLVDEKQKSVTGAQIGVVTLITPENATDFYLLGLELENLGVDFWLIRPAQSVGRFAGMDEAFPSLQVPFSTLLSHDEKLPTIVLEGFSPSQLPEAVVKASHGSGKWRLAGLTSNLPWSVILADQS